MGKNKTNKGKKNKRRNLVAKYAEQFNRPKTHKDRTKYDRKKKPPLDY